VTTRRRRPTTRPARARRRRTSGGSWAHPARRRRRRGLPATIGAALGTLAVTSLLSASWAVRIGLLLLVLLAGLGYLAWTHRAEAAEAAAPEGAPPDPAAEEPPGPPGAQQGDGP